MNGDKGVSVGTILSPVHRDEQTELALCCKITTVILISHVSVLNNGHKSMLQVKIIPAFCRSIQHKAM